MAVSLLVVVAGPAHAASHTYTTCSSLAGNGPTGGVLADINPPIGFGDPVNSTITIQSPATFTGCSGPDFTGTASLTASNVHTFKPGNCTTFAQGSPGHIIALGNFTANWSSGGPSSGVLKAKGNNDGNPTHIVIVLKITSGQFLAPSGAQPTKIKSSLVTFNLVPGHGDCVNSPVDQVEAKNVNSFVVSRKL
jgi:hypothetical protein